MAADFALRSPRIGENSGKRGDFLRNLRMDDFDRRLLQALQRDNQQTHEALGAEVGLSASAVRRRVARLRRDGIIRADVSLLDAARVGVTVIVMIRFEKESNATYDAFKRRMIAAPQIAQCYTVSGEADFVLIGHFRDLASYDQWVERELLSSPAVARSTTSIVYRTVKFETAVPVDEP